MNLILIIVGAFIGCLFENIALGVIQYFLKQRLVKKQLAERGVYGRKQTKNS